MGRKTHLIPRAAVSRILINTGAKRVSAPAVDSFAEILTDIALDISTRAIKIAKHSKRKTILEGDIKLAAQ